MTIPEMLKAAESMTNEQGRQAIRDAAACRESRRVSREQNDCTCFCCQYDRWHVNGQPIHRGETMSYQDEQTCGRRLTAGDRTLGRCPDGHDVAVAGQE